MRWFERLFGTWHLQLRGRLFGLSLKEGKRKIIHEHLNLSLSPHPLDTYNQEASGNHSYMSVSGVSVPPDTMSNPGYESLGQACLSLPHPLLFFMKLGQPTSSNPMQSLSPWPFISVAPRSSGRMGKGLSDVFRLQLPPFLSTGDGG